MKATKQEDTRKPKRGGKFWGSGVWSRWLELRKKNPDQRSKMEKLEYNKLEPIVSRELAKIHNYIPIKIKD